MRGLRRLIDRDLRGFSGDVRPALAIIAVVVACGSYLLGASVAPSADGSDLGGEVGLSEARGIDSCEFPGVPALRYLWNHNKYEFAYLGFYVGGIVAAGPEGECKRRFSKGGVNQLHAIGYDFLPLMDGRQPPCSRESTSPSVHFSENPSDNFRKARVEAAEEVDTAVKRMREVGLTTPGSIVYYDLESFTQSAEHPNCLAATKEFVNNWDRRLKEAYGATSGLYGPVEGAHVDQFWTLNFRPADLWFSEIQVGEEEVPNLKERREINEKQESVWAVPSERLPPNHWPDRRLHQWEKDAPFKTESGKPLHFDFSCAMGLVAGTGGKRSKAACQAK
jgi:hypothetical protein